jgi:hypothetical protein
LSARAFWFAIFGGLVPLGRNRRDPACAELPEPRRRATSSGVRPKLASRSSLMSLSQRRMRCFAGSSLASTSLRTRLDRAFRHPAGGVHDASVPAFHGHDPFCFRNRDWIDQEILVAPRYDIITASENWVSVVANGVVRVVPSAAYQTRPFRRVPFARPGPFLARWPERFQIWGLKAAPADLTAVVSNLGGSPK